MEMKFGDTQIRAGRQQIVWGKTDAFRLQDIVNPIDFSTHNVYPSLEERRIPSLSIDIVHSFGTLGPLEDFSVELVWVVDKFKPLQVGQCGDFWAFTAACEGRADVGAHGLLNQSVARVEERDWQLQNTEPGMRIEWRIPEPSIAFSLSGFWGFQDAPVAEFKNHYTTTNPNPAMMLFLQGLGVPGAIIPAFNAYDEASINASSANALGTWGALFGPAGAACPDTPADANATKALCIAGSGLQALGWIWSASQAELQYNRVFTLGGSLDYQIPGIDTVLRLETAYDFDRAINNTNKANGLDHSDVLMAAIGLDRSFFIPILNKDRTAFVSFQTFAEHVLNHDGNNRRGMVVYETNVISTFFIENYWRNDSIVLTNFFAYDWAAKAWITGPKLKWVMNDKISFEVGVNLLGGKKAEHNIRDICPSGGYDCLGDPDDLELRQLAAHQLQLRALRGSAVLEHGELRRRHDAGPRRGLGGSDLPVLVTRSRTDWTARSPRGGRAVSLLEVRPTSAVPRPTSRRRSASCRRPRAASRWSRPSDGFSAERPL